MPIKKLYSNVGDDKRIKYTYKEKESRINQAPNKLYVEKVKEGLCAVIVEHGSKTSEKKQAM